jgi:peptidoglycan-N-acetylglucosamine deacetylase
VKPVASLSLDLDNAWSYLKTRGDARWESYPSYLDVVVPRALDELARHDLRITVFLVGHDADQPEHRDLLAAIPGAGHEVGNHSYRHEPWLHLYSEAELDDELARTEDAIVGATGTSPTGFRGPGYSLSEPLLHVLVRRGYRYDASTLPTYLGPLARALYFRQARLDADQRRERAMLFGSLHDGTRPLKPYRWVVGDDELLELPVTTFPWVKVPFHVSYLLTLAGISPVAARAYFRSALRACAASGVEPSILLHPLDFLGAEDAPALDFFPGMGMSTADKLHNLRAFLGILTAQHEVVPVGEHADRLGRQALPRRAPDFRDAQVGSVVTSA